MQFSTTCLLLFLASSIFSNKANAILCTTCLGAVQGADSRIWQEAEDQLDDRIDTEFKRVQSFIIHEMWEQSILPAMMLAAEQFTAVAMQQAMAVGMLIDAESQLDAQRLLQEIRAKTHKNYHPSIGMCEFGSLMKSVAATERRGEMTAVILSQRSLDRQLGQRDSAGMYGYLFDLKSRITQFKRVFCNEKDRDDALKDPDNAMASLCPDIEWNDTAFNQDARKRMNKDIDYFALVDTPWNLNLDFTNQQILNTSAPTVHNEDEEHVMAMASNLYGHDNFTRIPGKFIVNNPDKPLTAMQRSYMDMRSIIAKRSVAENSFYAISAMKAEGNRAPPGSTDPMNARLYMEHILDDLGVPNAEILDVLGENPSYYAQMEVLTKKLYQNPDFYTNLYDKPANVERKTVALQAIKLMQKFDILKSFLRGEASFSILLELAVMDLQNEIEDQIQAISKRGK